MTETLDTLEGAARASIRIEPDPTTGLRPGDPLVALIPDWIDAHVASDNPNATPRGRAFARGMIAARVWQITGTTPEQGGPGFFAPRARSILRRWALRTTEEEK